MPCCAACGATRSATTRLAAALVRSASRSTPLRISLATKLRVTTASSATGATTAATKARNSLR